MSDKTAQYSAELGDCFEVTALAAIEAKFHGLLEDGREVLLEPTVVHAIINPAGSPSGPHAHAWIEVEDEVVELSRGQHIAMHRDEYYELAGVEPSLLWRYSRNEVAIRLLEFLHFGPWEGPEAVPPLTFQEAVDQLKPEPTRGA